MASGAALAAEVRARLDAPRVPVDETVLLTVEAFDVEGALDTRELERAFDVSVRSRANRLEIVDGQRGAVSTFVLELAPRATGLFTVPPVRVGPAASDSLTLEVVESRAGAGRDVFVEAEVDEPAPWVQARTLLTVRVWVRVGVNVMDAKLGEPEGPDLVIEPLGDDRRGRRERDGRAYDVVERRYAVFPRASGKVVLQPPALEVRLPADPDRARERFSASPRLVRRARPVRLDVRPRPPGGAAWWLPARAVTLAADWPDGAAARVGEPLTRTVSVRAEGVRAEQLPALPDADVDGAAVHADAPESASAATGDGLVAERRTVQTIIPERPGTLELPALEVAWFDTAAGAARTAVLPAETLQVAPSRGSVSGPVELADAGTSAGSSADGESAAAGATGDGRRSRLVVAAAVIGGLAAVAALVAARRHRATLAGPAPPAARGTRPTSHASALAALRKAGRRGAPAALARATLDLAALRWRRDPPRGLPALVARLESRDLAAALVALDARLYGRGTPAGPTPAPGTMTPAELADGLGAALAPAAGGCDDARGSHGRRGDRTPSLPPL